MQLAKALGVIFVSLTLAFTLSCGKTRYNQPLIDITNENFVPADELPKQSVIGLDQTYSPGEIVMLKVTPPEGNITKLVVVNYNWLVYDYVGNLKKNVVIFPGNETLVFGAGISTSNKFTVCLIATYVFQDNKNIIVKSQTFIGNVFVGELPNPPNPPVPNPDPIFPDGKYKLANFAYKTFKEAIPTSLSSIQKHKLAVAMSTAYISVSSAISAGTLKDIQTIMKATQEANIAVLAEVGIDKSQVEVFRNSFNDYIYELYSTNKLVSPNDFAIAWREIAEGLSKL